VGARKSAGYGAGRRAQVKAFVGSARFMGARPRDNCQFQQQWQQQQQHCCYLGMHVEYCHESKDGDKGRARNSAPSSGAELDGKLRKKMRQDRRALSPTPRYL
jgi:hypothetical protein